VPRIGLKTLLRDLNAANVRRYVKNGAVVEVEFWTPADAPRDPNAAREDRREAALEEAQAERMKAKTLRDPLVVATQELSLDDELEN
jgi:hypothetical protein